MIEHFTDPQGSELPIEQVLENLQELICLLPREAWILPGNAKQRARVRRALKELDAAASDVRRRARSLLAYVQGREYGAPGRPRSPGVAS